MIALVADRDFTGRGVEVEMFGRSALDPRRSGAALAHDRRAAHRHADVHDARRLADRDPRAADDRAHRRPARGRPELTAADGRGRSRRRSPPRPPTGTCSSRGGREDRVRLPLRLGRPGRRPGPRPRAGREHAPRAWPRRAGARAGRRIARPSRGCAPSAGRSTSRTTARTRRSIPARGRSSGGARRAARVPPRRRPRARAVHAEHVDVGDPGRGRARGRHVPPGRRALACSTTWRPRSLRSDRPSDRRPRRGLARRGARRGRADRRVVRDRAERRGRRAVRRRRARRRSGEGDQAPVRRPTGRAEGVPARPSAAFGRVAAIAPDLRLSSPVTVRSDPPSTALSPGRPCTGSRCSAPCRTSTCRRSSGRATSSWARRSVGRASGSCSSRRWPRASRSSRATSPATTRWSRDGVEGCLVPPRRRRRRWRRRRGDRRTIRPWRTALGRPAGTAPPRSIGAWSARGSRRSTARGRSATGPLTIGRDARRLDPASAWSWSCCSGPCSPTTGSSRSATGSRTGGRRSTCSCAAATT